MPLSVEEISTVRDEFLADDLEITEEMANWSLDECSKYFESGGKLVPAAPMDDRVPTIKARGNDLLKAGDLEGAVVAYREALALCATSHPDAAALHSNVAQALLKLGRAEEALKAAEACVGAKPSWQKAHYRQGDALFALSRFDEARAAYEAALKIAPNDADVARAARLALEAAKGGLWFRQLLPGRDIALTPTTPDESLVFGAAKQMKNLIYLVGDARSRECYAVDACWDTRGIAAFAATHKMKIVGAISTHYHFDHAGGAVPPQLVAMVYGPMGKPGGASLPGLGEMGRDHGAKLYCHALERERLAKQCSVELSELHPLEQGTRLPLGSAGSIEVLHTPGHSGGSVCLCVQDSGATQSLIVGDTIFPGSCGRLDLPDSDKRAMYQSLQKLRSLDDAIAIYPGHAYSGERTTVAQEKRGGLLRPFSLEQWLSMHG